MASGRRAAFSVPRKTFQQVIDEARAVGSGDLPWIHKDGSVAHQTMHQLIRGEMNGHYNRVNVGAWGPFSFVACFDKFMAELNEDLLTTDLINMVMEELYNLREWAFLVENYPGPTTPDPQGFVLCYDWTPLSQMSSSDKAEMKQWLVAQHPVL
ncbi:hypothetical protein TI39_contig644g00001 [Zymoseptoria brevis]|uniref:Uncharacterized protein n=1 Tax=Zymoseptoria brevis TaxID=1047168 RepID=A0A0F4GFZ4_9PEZI|nr:hypothetical protein TI39_contig644g00001 [Zymoseptoria brevis]